MAFDVHRRELRQHARGVAHDLGVLVQREHEQWLQRAGLQDGAPDGLALPRACATETGVLKDACSWWQWEPQWGAAVRVCAVGLTCTVSHSSLGGSLKTTQDCSSAGRAGLGAARQVGERASGVAQHGERALGQKLVVDQQVDEQRQPTLRARNTTQRKARNNMRIGRPHRCQERYGSFIMGE